MSSETPRHHEGLVVEEEVKQHEFRSSNEPHRGLSSASDYSEDRKYFHSRRIKKGGVEKPWLPKKDPKEKWVTILPLLGLTIGLGIAGVLVWDGLRSVVNHNYCLVVDEHWSNGFDRSIWTKEAEVGGFGNGEFEQTTTTDENVFIKDGQLHIKPTLQDPRLVETDGSKIDLLAEGICSSKRWSDCVVSTNGTNGTIVNPVKSGRVSTRFGASIKYGRIEVTAKLPEGDWMWPAIWMLPVESKYGLWPRSGEIDIVESRGNSFEYDLGGNNVVSSALHWGPTSETDAWWRNHVKRTALHTTYASKFHTFGLEWSESYLFTYVDTRLMQIMYSKFDPSFWEKGQFPLSTSNGSKIDDPWSHTGNPGTPFDQDFYLILSVAVGGTNGWFRDGIGGKPWVDSSANAMLDFWKAKEEWQPTWGKDAQMTIQKVQIWQQQGYNGC